MVTSNKPPDKKVVTMSEPNNSAIVPQRTLLGEVNEHITCPLCRGYYIDATTIVECLHSFCRSCIIKHLQVKSYCPVCEMMINSAKPNIKLDKALQDIVYKLVPGLFQREMERRQHFYSSRPGPAASATPEQRGEDTERIIFSPEDVISFSLEYADATDTDSISSKSSDSNEPQSAPGTMRRYLQCPAVVNVSHLKKFLCMKFDIDSTLFAIDILYKRVPLPDYYTLMDIAYIYNWKRNEPMRFFYQIIDFVAIRNRIFDVNRKSSDFQDRKSSPTPTDETNISSPNGNINDNTSDASSGTESPSMLDENKTVNAKKIENNKEKKVQDTASGSVGTKKSDEDVEKSQFLNSFELTPKSNSNSESSSPSKSNVNELTRSIKEANPQNKNSTSKPDVEESLKRKYQLSSNAAGLKKLRIEIEKTKIPVSNTNTLTSAPPASSQPGKSSDPSKPINIDNSNIKTNVQSTLPVASKDIKPALFPLKLQDSPGLKRNMIPPPPPTILSPKRKPNEITHTMQPPPVQKTVSPLKLQLPKVEPQSMSVKSVTAQKPSVKRIPDLKPSIPSSTMHSKTQPVNKVRMDLLANNSDPTIDRSKIMSQVKTSLSAQTSSPTTSSGDPLKSLFNACNINIPSSLSITLTDQKEGVGDIPNVDTKQAGNKNLSSVGSGPSHKIPSSPVHNYIEIRKLPESDPKKQQKNDNSETKGIPSNKSELPSGFVPQIKTNKSSETSAKGPIPNLKPIADTKLAKQANNANPGITFQQTFEQQLQTLQTDKKPKLPKNKAQVPKLVPATPKAFSSANKLNSPINKPFPNTASTTPETKTGAALDLSTPHNNPIQISTPHSKAFETMQSIANLAKKQSMPPKGFPISMSQNRTIPSTPPRAPASTATTTTSTAPLRVHMASNGKNDKGNSSGVQIPSSNRSEVLNKNNLIKLSNISTSATSSPSVPTVSQNSPNPAQTLPRQTRSPSSSPKLVIAEDKQATNSAEQSANQSNQITSTQLFGINIPKTECPKVSPGPSKAVPKQVRPMTSTGKVSGIQQQPPITNAIAPNLTPSDYLSTQMLTTHHAIQACVRQQMEISNAWFKAQGFDLYKNMSSMAQHQKNQHDFNKDKQ